MDTPVAQAPKKTHRLEGKVTFNFKHIGFHNIDISDMQTDIQEAAQLLFYFSTNVEYDEDEEYYSSEAESEEEEAVGPVQHVAPNNSEADPEVSTLESDEYDDDELNDENISTLRREYGDYDDQQHYSDNDEYDNNDDNDSIS